MGYLLWLAASVKFLVPFSLFFALQDQIGLKLDAQTGPVEIFVIVSAEKPAAN